MGVAEDTYKILMDIWDRICGGPQRTRLSLAEYLQEIASLLLEVRLKLERREIPREEAKKLAILINDGDELASVFKVKYRGLAEVFDGQLPHVGRLMRDADFFIDERPRYKLHESFDVDDPQFSF